MRKPGGSRKRFSARKNPLEHRGRDGGKGACERTGFRQTPIQKRWIIKKLIGDRA
jgi:hypothetical protein